MKKRMGIIILSVLLVLGLVGCGNSVAKDEIKQEKEALNDKEEEKISNINENTDSEIKEIEGKKKAEKENNKQFYIKKLDNIERGIEKDLSELYGGTTFEMKEASSKEYKRWDDALNEIYGVLKTQLSSRDMSKLKEEEIKWISDKEKKAEDAAGEYPGGTMAPLAHIYSLAQTTKDRCYELVEKYME